MHTNIHPTHTRRRNITHCANYPGSCSLARREDCWALYICLCVSHHPRILCNAAPTYEPGGRASQFRGRPPYNRNLLPHSDGVLSQYTHHMHQTQPYIYYISSLVAQMAVKMTTRTQAERANKSQAHSRLVTIKDDWNWIIKDSVLHIYSYLLCVFLHFHHHHHHLKPSNHDKSTLPICAHQNNENTRITRTNSSVFTISHWRSTAGVSCLCEAPLPAPRPWISATDTSSTASRCI